jgi:hypothetical protein
MGLVNQSTLGNAMRGHTTRQEDAKSPGSDGVSPYRPSIVLVLLVGSGELNRLNPDAIGQISPSAKRSKLEIFD